MTCRSEEVMKRLPVVFMRRTLQATAVAVLVLSALLLSACGDGGSYATTERTLFPLQRSFMQELSEDGYIVGVLAEQAGGEEILTVWVPVDPEETTPAANDAIFDHVVAMAEKYGAAEAAGGRLRVELFDSKAGGSVKEAVFESRDFDLSETTTVTETTTACR